MSPDAAGTGPEEGAAPPPERTGWRHLLAWATAGSWKWFLAYGFLGVLLFVLTLTCLREWDLRRVRRTVDDQARRGLPTTFEDLLAGAPRFDARLQEDCHAACEALEALGEGAVPGGDGFESATEEEIARFLLEGAPRPERIGSALERSRAEVGRITALLREGGVLPTGLGRLPRERPGGSSIEVAMGILENSGVPLLAVARWHRYAALLEEDPAARLAALADCIRAWREPVGFVEAACGLHLRYERERAHIELALQDRLSPDAEMAFLAEEPDAVALTAAAWRWYRLAFPCMFAEDLLAGRIGAQELIGGGRPGRTRTDGFRTWLILPDDVAQALEVADGVDRLLRGDPGAPSAAALERTASAVDLIPVDPVAFTLRFASFCEGRSKAARVAVRLIRLRRVHGVLPADEAEARRWLGPAASLMDAGGTAPRIRYERPAPGVLRLVVDPSAGPAALLGDGSDPPVPWDPGAPPSGRAFRFLHQGVEVRFPE